MINLHYTKRHLSTIGFVTIFYGINILLGLGQNALLAAKFGATEQLDALLIGLNFVRTLGIQLALAVASVFIPFFTPMILADDTNLVADLSCKWLRISGWVLIPLSFVLAVCSFPLAKLLGPGLNDAGIKELSRSLLMLSPVLMILAVAGLGKALSDSYNMYFIFPLFLGLCSLGIIVGVILGYHCGVQSASVGLMAGGVGGLVMQALLIKKRLPFLKECLIPRAREPSENLPAPPKLPIKNVTLLLGSSFLVLLQGVVERAYASHLPAGSIVALNLGLNVLGVPSTLVLPATSAILLPLLSRLEERGESKIFGLPWQYYLIILIGSIAVTLLLFFGSDFIVRVLFLRGKFSEEAASLTSMVIKVMVFGFCAYVFITILRQTLIARKMVTLDALINGLTLAIKIVILTILVPKYGLKGLAIAIVSSTFVTATFYIGIIYYQYRLKHG